MTCDRYMKFAHMVQICCEQGVDEDVGGDHEEHAAPREREVGRDGLPQRAPRQPLLRHLKAGNESQGLDPTEERCGVLVKVLACSRGSTRQAPHAWPRTAKDVVLLYTHYTLHLKPKGWHTSILSSTVANREMEEGGSRQETVQLMPPYGTRYGIRYLLKRACSRVGLAMVTHDIGRHVSQHVWLMNCGWMMPHTQSRAKRCGCLYTNNRKDLRLPGDHGHGVQHRG